MSPVRSLGKVNEWPSEKTSFPAMKISTEEPQHSHSSTNWTVPSELL